MSKQKEIREQMMLQCPCPDDPRDCWSDDCETCESKANTVQEMFSYLHSQGLRLPGGKPLIQEG